MTRLKEKKRSNRPIGGGYEVDGMTGNIPEVKGVVSSWRRNLLNRSVPSLEGSPLHLVTFTKVEFGWSGISSRLGFYFTLMKSDRCLWGGFSRLSPRRREADERIHIEVKIGPASSISVWFFLVFERCLTPPDLHCSRARLEEKSDTALMDVPTGGFK